MKKFKVITRYTEFARECDTPYEDWVKKEIIVDAEDKETAVDNIVDQIVNGTYDADPESVTHRIGNCILYCFSHGDLGCYVYHIDAEEFESYKVFEKLGFFDENGCITCKGLNFCDLALQLISDRNYNLDEFDVKCLYEEYCLPADELAKL